MGKIGRLFSKISLTEVTFVRNSDVPLKTSFVFVDDVACGSYVDDETYLSIVYHTRGLATVHLSF